MEPEINQYLKFMRSLKNNDCSWDEWKNYQHRVYRNEKLEKTRSLVNSICEADESIGNPDWPLSNDAIARIEHVIEECLENDI